MKKKHQKHKQLSAPYSTSGGGAHFEARVQALFVILMQAGGFVPGVARWPLTKIKLQGKFDNYDTDDAIFFVAEPSGSRQQKLLVQITHSISFAKSNSKLSEVIQSAWNDFNNTELFTKGQDAIALITGPLSDVDIKHTRTILEWARHAENADEFTRKIKLPKFSSSEKEAKLEAFRHHLKNANDGREPSNEDVFQFLQHFHILSCDLDVESGTTLSLLSALIGHHSLSEASSVWAQVIEAVEIESENAGTITKDSLPEHLQAVFKQQIHFMPSTLSANPAPIDKIDWNHQPYAADLALANLVGSWNEKYDADCVLISNLVGEDFDSWTSKVQEVLQHPESPISLQNGVWQVIDRSELWQVLGSRIYDKNLDAFEQCVTATLTEIDPKFDLPSKKRFAAKVHKKELLHSSSLRKGLAESLALLGSNPGSLTNCSTDMPQAIARSAVRKILQNADWKLWGSLNSLLPLLAEAAPDEFLEALEQALEKSPCPFDELFQQEGNGLTGTNYLTGILWALESLAWDSQFLVRVCVILSELASHDPGGRWANRPFNSLATILFPWYPQTLAPINKRKVALQTIEREVPEITWKLLLKLLPNPGQMSSGSHKPLFRNIISDNETKKVTVAEYQDQLSLYIEMAIEAADHNIERLIELIKYVGSFPASSFDRILNILSSEAIYKAPGDAKLRLWHGLTDLVSKYKNLATTKQTFAPEKIAGIETVAAKLAPDSPLELNQKLFGKLELYSNGRTGSWEEKGKALQAEQQKAVEVILSQGGVEDVFKFARSVDTPGNVGYSLGAIAEDSIDPLLLPALLESDEKKIVAMVTGYVQARFQKSGWEWVDQINLSDWTQFEIGRLLTLLPFTSETWSRTTKLLGNSEEEYWHHVNPNPYATNDLGHAIDKLIEYDRSILAIACLGRLVDDNQPLDIDRSVRALLSVSTKDTESVDSYCLIKLIKALQDESGIDPESLFKIEWKYLQLMVPDSGASPKLLEQRLASDSDFFCQVIRLLYRSEKEIEGRKSPNKKEQLVAENVWHLFHQWHIPPGVQPDGSFSEEQFRNWLENTKKACLESGHFEVAMRRLGAVLFYSPADPSGLWINKVVAEALNEKDAKEMRSSFALQIRNSRGVHEIDPSGEPERELARKYRQMAEEVENAGFQRLAATLKNIAETYDHDAEEIVNSPMHLWS